jgi:hypothetical protein
LNRPQILKLELESRRCIIELMDATYYLYDLLAIRNSRNLLNKFQLDVKSIYSPTLGSYHRISPDEAAINRALGDFSQKKIRQIEKDLPSPPKRKHWQKIGE